MSGQGLPLGKDGAVDLLALLQQVNKIFASDLAAVLAVLVGLGLLRSRGGSAGGGRRRGGSTSGVCKRGMSSQKRY